MDEISQDNQGVESRVAATHALAQVFERGVTLDEALDRVGAKYRLSDADRRLVHAICGFTFRNLPAIDTVLRQIMDRKRDPSPKLLHQLLRVGVVQILYMDVAEHAAVHATVSAAGSLHLSRQKGLINAVLRSVQRQRDTLVTTAPDALDTLPEWLRKRWVASYGESQARTLVKAMGQEAPIDLTIKDAHASLEWAQKLGGDVIIPGSVRVRQGVGQIASWPGFTEGAWWVQDAAASLPIKVLGDVAQKSVLDVCAAPGGKTLQLAAAGARVTALDVSGSRMQRVTGNIMRVIGPDAVTTIVSDAHHWRTDDRFDVIVLDAPCSSTGTLRRHPEHPWIHSEISVSKNALTQCDLLRRATELLAHEGKLLYCTCSLEVEEGEDQVEAFLNQYKDFKQITAIADDLKPFVKTGKGGFGFRTFPTILVDQGGMDGFFFAVLQKQ